MKKALVSTFLFPFLASTAIAADLPAGTATETTTSVTTTQHPAPTTTVVTTTAATPAIDCNYRIPAGNTAIDSKLITTWAEKAVLQSFNFTPAQIQNQLDTLKLCYTDQGWKGFNEALQKSGNIDSIKTQQLNVSSQTDGQSTVNTVKDNQWKISLPILVVYQNDKEKVTQHLVVNLLVGRKPNGDLGIMQLIATAPAPGTVSVEPSPTPVSVEVKPATTTTITTPVPATPTNP